MILTECCGWLYLYSEKKRGETNLNVTRCGTTARHWQNASYSENQQKAWLLISPLTKRDTFLVASKQNMTSLNCYLFANSAKLKITTRTSSGKPCATFVGLTVTDDSVNTVTLFLLPFWSLNYDLQKMTEKRKRYPHMLPMVLLEDEVDHLNAAHAYFKSSTKNPSKAINAIDLLLGTQGYRVRAGETSKRIRR